MEISDRGLRFPFNDRTDMAFSAISMIKTPEVNSNFPHPLWHSRGHLRSCSLTEMNLEMCSKPQATVSLPNVAVLCPYFFCCFRPYDRSFYSQLKRAVEPRKSFITPCHYKKILPAQQPIRVCVL